MYSRFSFVHRTKIDLLKKTDRFLRELKNLDNRRWYVDIITLLSELELHLKKSLSLIFRLVLQAAILANHSSKQKRVK